MKYLDIIKKARIIIKKEIESMQNMPSFSNVGSGYAFYADPDPRA